MWRLTRCCVAVILVCEIVAALEDPYILLTKRLNKIERNVNENFEDFRAEITTMLDIIKGINSSVFDLKKMFVNKMANDSYAKHTEPVNATHLMSIHNGFRAEKKARVQLTYDLNRILLSLQKHNSSVDAKLGTLERNLTDVVRRMVANSISLIKMQENFESKQKSVEDNVREHNQYFHGLLQDHNSSVSAKLGTLERNLTDAVRTMAANRMSLTKMQENFESKQKSVEDSVRELTAGYAGGSSNTDKGSTADFLCLPESPSWAKYQNESNRCGSVYGSQYFLYDYNPFGVNSNDNVPCCVCNVPRTAIIMIPGRVRCFLGWTMEYTGYLMSGSAASEGATNYVCVDQNPEKVIGESDNNADHTMCLVQARCGTLPCPPYVHGRQLACVVCSK